MFMIINESERNRIKSLYGLITEDAPPSESVLVANKNPFIGTEYNSAKRFYSPELKNGEMFFAYDGQKLKDLMTNQINSLLNGKTIRFQIKGNYHYLSSNIISKDSIGKFISVDQIELKKSGVVGSQCIKDMTLNIDTDFKVDSYELKDFELLFDPNDNGFHALGFRFRSGRYEVISIEVPSKDQINNSIYNISSWTKLPNDIFEIRKIQRQTTDF